MKQNLTHYSDNELYIITLNDLELYNMYRQRQYDTLVSALDNRYMYTDDQLHVLTQHFCGGRNVQASR